MEKLEQTMTHLLFKFDIFFYKSSTRSFKWVKVAKKLGNFENMGIIHQKWYSFIEN
jgi:hypothetical protein